MQKIYLIAIFISISLSLVAQQQTSDSAETKINHNWYNKSANIDQIYGAEVDKAYDQLLKDKKSTTVIVAVIDGGIDITHEDLKNKIWVNKNEIPDNGIDDDHNGYIDDIHGWNFLVNEKGDNISYDNLEVTRVYRKFKDQFENIEPKNLSAKEKSDYELFKKAEKIYLKNKKEALLVQKQLKIIEEKYKEAIIKLQWYLDTNIVTPEAVNKIKSDDKVLMHHVNLLKYLYKNDFTFEELKESKKYISEQVNYHYNLNFIPREIIGDSNEDISTTYGNNNVYGPEANHGTFVAGIIAAERNNNLGIDGIASDIKVMALKAVPNGDERDKDVAKAIRYAVDNGARIINMSFGKELSPQKKLVDNAILYAEKNGILLIHAAGNEGLNNDKIEQYPTKMISNGYKASNWITVGASSMKEDLDFVTDFSNYGKEMVDIFAPGVEIESLAPESTYDTGDGTSFSAPVVSGVAALILSYYPELNYSELKDIILNSASKYPKSKVYRPNAESKRRKKTKFGKLSATGGIINAYNALKMAENISK